VTDSVIDWVILAIICAQRESVSSAIEGGGGSLEAEGPAGRGGGNLEAEEPTGRGGAEGISAIEIDSTDSRASGVR
jgi:hypothetical protein